LALFFIIRGKRKAQQASKQKQSEAQQAKAKAKAKANTSEAKAKAKRTMSNPKSFMEPIWEQDKDAGYDFSDEAYAEDNAYYSKYGGNECIVCMGGSYIRRVNINTPAASAASAASAYSKYDGGNADDYYEEEEDYEDYEDYEDDTNDY
jgi:hypothetical protein